MLKAQLEILEREEERARARDALRRKELGLTVTVQVVKNALCLNCHHSWPYKNGDENKPCPACGGGKAIVWSK